jgi:hypothetical protein
MTLKVAFCGCSNDWAIIDDEMPCTEEYYYGLCACGFESEQEANDYIAVLKAGVPGLSYWAQEDEIERWRQSRN